jgi:transcription initiation factor IIE alpha subunit
MNHYNWYEFEKYAVEFLCPSCDRKVPTRENDKCIDVCMKSWINYLKQKEDDDSIR